VKNNHTPHKSSPLHVTPRVESKEIDGFSNRQLTRLLNFFVHWSLIEKIDTERFILCTFVLAFLLLDNRIPY